MAHGRSDYQPLAQSIDERLSLFPHDADQHSRGRRRTRQGPVDLRKLDLAFKRWTENIAQKVKGKKKVEDNSRKQILRSVFEPSVSSPSLQNIFSKTLDHGPPMTKSDYDAIVHSIRQAIAEGAHPKMISKGSSGSYFARAKTDGRVHTVAVFKPKDEEPYGNLNPKTTKWLHRQLRWIIPFGRSCLIPNLSYISEAAASLLDQRLNLHIVPRTELVSFSSPAFFYDWLDRNAARKGKPLPEKIGSLQCFMHGYQDASDFLRKHPLPGRLLTDTFDDSTHRSGRVRKRLLDALKVVCGRAGDEEDMFFDEEEPEEQTLFDAEEESPSRPFYWSAQLLQSFREELEKLVILDYLMRNTDRGADNYMIKYCEGDHEKTLVDVAPTRSGALQMQFTPELRYSEANGVNSAAGTPRKNGSASPPMNSAPNLSYTRQPHIHIAAIDNSLSFPHEHPRGWRSFTYGWLFLPISVIGRPFSEKTRNHFLPLLTSKAWWEETTYELRKLFAIDPDFNRKMFQRQLAVIKGQAWNIVQSLKHSDEGPLELTRRQLVLVWDDEEEVDDDVFNEMMHAPVVTSPKPSINTMPPPSPTKRRSRSQSQSNDFPPPMRRSSTDAFGSSRPVSFSTKFPRVHPGTTGVTVLKHMERVDAVEAGLRRLVVDESFIEEEIEDDVGEQSDQREADELLPSSPTQPQQAAEDVRSPSSSSSEEDLVALSRSTPHLDFSPRRTHNHQESPSNGSGWIADESKKRVVIVERLETVKNKAFFSCW